ncbi:response regulator transcription factor [bacterium]|nr:response regulator transcription factor [bacterium]MDA7679985.1 response regulator transcription factor [bacterium]
MKLSKHILVVEDEPDTAELLEFHLENAGYKVTIAEDGYEALKKIHKLRPDLLILDLMIPEIDGFEVCRLIRKDPANESLPVMMCTAKGDETSKIQGLDFGADDYVTKPFSPREVVLRVKNLLKRSDSVNRPDTELLSIGKITIDKNSYEVSVEGELLELTATEFKLLVFFTERKGRVQSRDILLRDVWGYESNIDTRTVDTHVQRLRTKLKGASDNLVTVRGFGYKFLQEA